MPRTQAQFEEMRQATKEKIQDAASRLFAQKGIAGTNVQQIADHAGISIGLLYRHYKTKEELFNDLVVMASMGLVETTKMLLSDGNPKDILIALTTEMIEDYNNSDEFNDYLTFLTQAFLSGFESEALKQLIENDRELLDALSSLIERGQSDGTFRAGNPKALACAYMSAVQGIGIFRKVMRADFTVPTVDVLLSFLF